MQGIEATHPCFIDRRLAATRHHRCAGAKAYVVEGIDQCIVPAGTGAHGHITRATQGVAHADQSGSTIRDHFRNEERVESWGAVAFAVADALILEGLQTTDTTSPDHTDTIAVDTLRQQATVLHCFIAANQCELSKGVHLPGLLPIEEILWVEALHLTGELRFEFARIEARYGRSSATAAHETLPVILEVVAERRKRAQTGDDHTSELHRRTGYLAFFSTYSTA